MSDERAESRPEDEPVQQGGALAVQPEKPKPALETGDQGYIVPKTMDEAYRMAVAVVQARLAPDSYANDPSKVMLGIAAAMEAGLPPLYGLRQIAIINGRPTIFGEAAMALIQARGLIAKRVVREIGPGLDTDTTPRGDWPDTYGFSVSLYRRGQGEDAPYVGTFTIADAKRAKLWDDHRRQPWQLFPKRMLMIRAQTLAQRDGFADALAGLAIREETEDTFGADKAVTDTAFLDDTPALTDETSGADLAQTDQPEPESVERDLGTEADRKLDF